jgi:hypothetical protein
MIATEITTNSPDHMLTIDSLRNPRRRTGQIARLPKAIRDQLNQMIQDGISYLDIIQKLGSDGEGLTEDMLSKWKNRGYLEWLEDCRITDAMRARYEFAHNLVTEAGDPRQASRAVLHTLAANLCHMLAQIDPVCVRESVLSDADKFSRFVHAVVRLAEGSIKCEEHKTKEDEREAQKNKAARRKEKPGISEEALAAAEASLQLL